MYSGGKFGTEPSDQVIQKRKKEREKRRKERKKKREKESPRRLENINSIGYRGNIFQNEISMATIIPNIC